MSEIVNEYDDMVFPSGKYAGELIADVCCDNDDYCNWVVNDSNFSDDVKTACKYHMGWEDWMD